LGEEELYPVIEYILNQATTEELKVVVAALKKRLAGSSGPMGLDPGKMAKAMSDSINRQVDSSLQQIHENVRDFVAALIKEEAPDIPEEHLRELVDTWTPDPHGRINIRSHSSEDLEGGEGVNESRESASAGSQLPRDVLFTMVKQFLTYSLGAMSIREQQQLHDDIPDWQETYWNRFPPRVRKLLSLILKGQIDEDTFWERLKSEFDFNDF